MPSGELLVNEPRWGMWLSSSRVRLRVEFLGEDLGWIFTGFGARGTAALNPESVVIVEELAGGLKMGVEGAVGLVTAEADTVDVCG